jgi:hypothetical protein
MGLFLRYDRRVKRFLATLLAFTSAVALSGQGKPFDSAQGRSRWVYFDDQQRLHYGTDARGNRIMDFSHAGYKGGGVALPMVRVARSRGAPTASAAPSCCSRARTKWSGP